MCVIENQQKNFTILNKINKLIMKLAKICVYINFELNNLLFTYLKMYKFLINNQRKQQKKFPFIWRFL